MELVAEYLWQILVALGGSVVTLGIAAVRWKRGQPIGEDVVWPAVACIFIALVGVAYQEHVQRVAAEELGKPLLVATTAPAFVMPVSDATNKYLGADVLIRAEIINRGAPSIAKDYRLFVQTAHGQSTFNPTLLSALPQFGDPVQERALTALRVKSQNDLGERTSHPIERGGMQTGWLRFMVRDVPMDDLISASTFVLNFNDYLGQTYAREVKGRATLDTLECPNGAVAQCYLPGMEGAEASKPR
jgi:hypothetical protein